jgi:hypothetical protein
VQSCLLAAWSSDPTLPTGVRGGRYELLVDVDGLPVDVLVSASEPERRHARLRMPSIREQCDDLSPPVDTSAS